MSFRCGSATYTQGSTSDMTQHCTGFDLMQCNGFELFSLPSSAQRNSLYFLFGTQKNSPTGITNGELTKTGINQIVHWLHHQKDTLILAHRNVITIVCVLTPVNIYILRYLHIYVQNFFN